MIHIWESATHHSDSKGHLFRRETGHNHCLCPFVISSALSSGTAPRAGWPVLLRRVSSSKGAEERKEPAGNLKASSFGSFLTARGVNGCREASLCLVLGWNDMIKNSVHVYTPVPVSGVYTTRGQGPRRGLQLLRARVDLHLHSCRNCPLMWNRVLP